MNEELDRQKQIKISKNNICDRERGEQKREGTENKNKKKSADLYDYTLKSKKKKKTFAENMLPGEQQQVD